MFNSHLLRILFWSNDGGWGVLGFFPDGYVVIQNFEKKNQTLIYPLCIDLSLG